MTYYVDVTGENGCCAILFTDPENKVVYAGTVVHTEEEKYRDHELARRLERECDFHFYFRGDRLPELYTVPQTEIAGFDSQGGLFAGIGSFSLRGEPLYYIDREGSCFLITDDSGKFLEMGKSWRESMVPADDIELFASRTQAEQVYRIWSWQELLEEGDL